MITSRYVFYSAAYFILDCVLDFIDYTPVSLFLQVLKACRILIEKRCDPDFVVPKGDPMTLSKSEVRYNGGSNVIHSSIRSFLHCSIIIKQLVSFAIT